MQVRTTPVGVSRRDLAVVQSAVQAVLTGSGHRLTAQLTKYQCTSSWKIHVVPVPAVPMVAFEASKAWGTTARVCMPNLTPPWPVPKSDMHMYIDVTMMHIPETHDAMPCTLLCC
jgi:hypothetical protein